MDVVLTAAATLLVGLSAGLFFTYSNSVLPGLHTTSDSVFVDAMTSMNRAILNPLFYLLFLGSVPVVGAAAATSFLQEHTGAGIGATVAGVLYVGGVLVPTMRINVPLNERLASTGDRDGFERNWVPWNAIRATFSSASFATLIATLATGFA